LVHVATEELKVYGRFAVVRNQVCWAVSIYANILVDRKVVIRPGFHLKLAVKVGLTKDGFTYIPKRLHKQNFTGIFEIHISTFFFGFFILILLLPLFLPFALLATFFYAKTGHLLLLHGLDLLKKLR
jgi:hypothetical protein